MMGVGLVLQGLGVGVRVWDKAASTRVGQRIVEAIRARTARGIGADGVPFDPYAPGYEHADSARPDLNKTGRLMGSLAVTRATPAGAAVEAPGVPYATEVDERRPFMGIAPADEAAIEAAALDELDRLLGAG